MQPLYPAAFEVSTPAGIIIHAGVFIFNPYFHRLLGLAGFYTLLTQSSVPTLSSD
jgi:hypothetical protein